MARRERIYKGEIEGPDGQVLIGELWSDGATAIVFRSPWNQTVAVLRDPSIGMAGDNGSARLSLTGTDDESGETVTWLARPAESTILNWVGVTVRYKDGTKVEGATVQATQYRVKVLKAGTETREFVGATATSQYGQRRITTLEGESIVVETKGGCGCGGSR